MACNGKAEETPAGAVEEADAPPPASQTTEEDASGADRAPGRFSTAGDLMGSRRLSAAVDRLEQELRSLQEELEEAAEGRVGPSSVSCGEVVAAVESVPDGLLPVTRGPQDVAWERWFQRVRGRGGEWECDGGGGRRWWMRGRRLLPTPSGPAQVEMLSK